MLTKLLLEPYARSENPLFPTNLTAVVTGEAENTQGGRNPGDATQAGGWLPWLRRLYQRTTEY